MAGSRTLPNCFSQNGTQPYLVVPVQRVVQGGGGPVVVEVSGAEDFADPHCAQAVVGFQPALALIFVGGDDLLSHPSRRS